MRSCVLPLLLAALAAGSDPYEQVLVREGIGVDAGSLREYLRTFDPDEGTKRRIAALVARLGAPDEATRSMAARRLVRLRGAPIKALQRALGSDDTEVRRRARTLLDKASLHIRPSLLYAAFATIERKPVRGLARAVLKALDVSEQRYVRDAAGRALTATAGLDDLPLLRRAQADATIRTRIAATLTVAHLLGAEARPELLELLENGDERMRYAAAHSLAELQDRACLAPLGLLLESTHAWVRARAAHVLRAISRTSFGYSARDTDPRRKAAIAKWREWIAARGPRATWKVPLGTRHIELGRTLIALYIQNKVIELDSGGNKIWEQHVPNPWVCIGLPDGNRLVTHYPKKTIVEYDGGGRVVWRKAGLPGFPTSLQRLENGNTLVSCGNQVLEIDPGGRIVWTITPKGRPTGAQRLPNGRTLVSLSSAGRVVEVDRTGKEVWSLTAARPYSAQRLENGNTLVCQQGGSDVVEYTRSGKVVWSHPNPMQGYHAQRLANGNTILSHQRGAIELDRNGKTVWEHKPGSHTWVHRY